MFKQSASFVMSPPKRMMSVSEDFFCVDISGYKIKGQFLHQPKPKHDMSKEYTTEETGGDSVAESRGRYSSF